MKKVILGLLIVVIITSMFACTQESTGADLSTQTTTNTPSANEPEKITATNAAKDWDILTVVVSTDPTSMDPTQVSHFAPRQVGRNVYEPLFTFDKDYNVIPCLADTWEYLDNCTLKVHINEAATFSNGEPVTATDVLFTLRRTPGTVANTYTSSIDMDTSYAEDDKTVIIKTVQPVANQTMMLCSAFTGIICESDYELKEGDFFQGIAGSGPYVFDSYLASDHYTLKKNEAYWNDVSCPNRIPMINFKIITETANRAIEIETGGADIVYNIGATDVDRIKNNEDIQYVSQFTFNGQYIAFNMEHTPLDNPQVREALWYATDRQTLVDLAYQGMGKLLNCAVVADLPGAADCSEFMVEPDYEKAKTMLAEAGYPDGFEITFTTENSVQERIDLAEALQAMWSDVGVTLKIDLVDGATMVSLNEGGKSDMTMSGLSASSGEAGSALLRFTRSASGRIYGMPEDDPYSEYVMDGLGAIDEADRYELYKKAAFRLMELRCAMPIWSKEVNAALASYVNAEGFRLEKSFEVHELWNVTWNK